MHAYQSTMKIKNNRLSQIVQSDAVKLKTYETIIAEQKSKIKAYGEFKKEIESLAQVRTQVQINARSITHTVNQLLVNDIQTKSVLNVIPVVAPVPRISSLTPLPIVNTSFAEQNIYFGHTTPTNSIEQSTAQLSNNNQTIEQIASQPISSQTPIINEQSQTEKAPEYFTLTNINRDLAVKKKQIQRQQTFINQRKSVYNNLTTAIAASQKSTLKIRQTATQKVQKKKQKLFKTNVNQQLIKMRSHLHNKSISNIYQPSPSLLSLPTTENITQPINTNTTTRINMPIETYTQTIANEDTSPKERAGNGENANDNDTIVTAMTVNEKSEWQQFLIQQRKDNKLKNLKIKLEPNYKSVNEFIKVVETFMERHSRLISSDDIHKHIQDTLLTTEMREIWNGVRQFEVDTFAGFMSFIYVTYIGIKNIENTKYEIYNCKQRNIPPKKYAMKMLQLLTKHDNEVKKAREYKIKASVYPIVQQHLYQHMTTQLLNSSDWTKVFRKVQPKTFYDTCFDDDRVI
jgi:hypothetical protein